MLHIEGTAKSSWDLFDLSTFLSDQLIRKPFATPMQFRCGRCNSTLCHTRNKWGRRFESARRLSPSAVNNPDAAIRSFGKQAPRRVPGFGLSRAGRSLGRSKPGTYGGRRMRRKAFLQCVGAQEEVDAREQAHLRPEFATPDDPVSRAGMRDIRRRFPHRSGQPFG